MNKYQCIRTCHAYGRIWNVGEILNLKGTANHHFILVEGAPLLDVPTRGDLPPTIQLKGRDVMKPNTSTSEATSFSEIQGNIAPINHGMAAGLTDVAPIKSMKQLKKK